MQTRANVKIDKITYQQTYTVLGTSQVLWHGAFVYL